MCVKKVSVRDDVYRALKALALERGESISDTIKWLIGLENERCYFCGSINKIQRHHIIPVSVARKLGVAEKDIPVIPLCTQCHIKLHALMKKLIEFIKTNQHQTKQPYHSRQPVKQRYDTIRKEKPDPSRKIAQDKIVCMSELAGRVHSPERLLQWYRKADNAVVIESDHDTCIVERQFLLDFLNNLDGIRDESEEFTGIVDAREKQLAKFLYESGIIYRAPDGWRLVDESFLNEIASGSK